MKKRIILLVIKKKNVAKNFNLPTNIPIFYAKNKEVYPYDKKTPVIAFAGIGYPEKFFNNINANLVETKSFPDHYQYSDDDVKDLITNIKLNWENLTNKEKQNFLERFINKIEVVHNNKN